MKTNAPPIQYDPDWLEEIAKEGKKPKGVGLTPGTIVATDDDRQRYIVAPGGALRKITVAPSQTAPGKFDVALERKPGNEFMSARQRRNFVKAMRRRLIALVLMCSCASTGQIHTEKQEQHQRDVDRRVARAILVVVTIGCSLTFQECSETRLYLHYVIDENKKKKCSTSTM